MHQQVRYLFTDNKRQHNFLPVAGYWRPRVSKRLRPERQTLFLILLPGSTSDTNVASGGVDILTSVAGGSYQLSDLPPPPPQSVHMLYLNPSSGAFRTGDIISAQIMLDTQSKSIDGVDAVLSYNRSYFEVEDESPAEAGIQILGSSLLPSTQRNEVNASTGKIYFSQTTSGGNIFPEPEHWRLFVSERKQPRQRYRQF